MFHTAPPAVVGWDVPVGGEVAWPLVVMMPVGPDTVGLLDVFAGRSPASGWVEVSGFGDAATALGFDLFGPGDA